MAELVSVQLYVYTAPAKQAGGSSYVAKNKKIQANVCEATTLLGQISGAAALGTAATGIGAPLSAGFGAIAAFSVGIAAATC